MHKRNALKTVEMRLGLFFLVDISNLRSAGGFPQSSTVIGCLREMKIDASLEIRKVAM